MNLEQIRRDAIQVERHSNGRDGGFALVFMGDEPTPNIAIPQPGGTLDDAIEEAKDRIVEWMEQSGLVPVRECRWEKVTEAWSNLGNLAVFRSACNGKVHAEFVDDDGDPFVPNWCSVCMGKVVTEGQGDD